MYPCFNPRFNALRSQIKIFPLDVYLSVLHIYPFNKITYEEFMVILTVALLIVAILSYTHKK